MGIFDRFKRTPPQKTEQPLGRSGTINTSGFLQSDDPNALWEWPSGLDIIEEMRRSDSTIKWMLALLTTPIRAAERAVEAATSASDDSGAYNEAAEIAAFCEHALFEQLDGGFDDFIRQALLYLAFGHYVFEVSADFRPVEFSYIDKDGNEQTVAREMFVIDRLAPRLPRTILQWNPVDGDRSQLRSITQWLGDGLSPTNVEIESERLVVFTHDKEGDDWRGNSILRSAYLPYRYKVKLENLEAIALERSAGLPVAYPPKDADSAQLDGMEAALRSVRQGETLYIVAPGPKSTAWNPEGWVIEELSIQGDANRSPDAAINRHDMAIARNVMAEFMKLGHEQTGARATADVQQDPYYQSLQAHVEYLSDQIKGQVIARLVAWNYPQAKQLPEFSFSKLQAKNLMVLGTFLDYTMKNKGITPDFPLENTLRDLAGLPTKELDDGQDPAELYAPTPPPVALPPGGDVPSKTPEKLGTGGKPKSLDAASAAKPGKPATMSDWAPSRTLHPAEESVRFAEIGKALDSLQAEIAQVGKRAMAEPIALAERQSEQVVAMADAHQVASIEVDPMAAQQAIHKVLVRAYERGKAEVESEIAAQMNTHGVRMAEQRKRRSLSDRLSAIDALATQAATSIADAVSRVVKAATLREIETGVRPTGPGYDPQMALSAAVRGAALNVTSAAFNDGRFDALQSNADVLEGSIYTAQLDSNSCETCADADGTESADPEGSADLPTPNPDCAGGGACRCMWVPVVDAGSQLVTASELPFPKDRDVEVTKVNIPTIEIHQAAPVVPAELVAAVKALAERPALPPELAATLRLLAERETIVNVAPAEVNFNPEVNVAAAEIPQAVSDAIIAFADQPQTAPVPPDVADALREIAQAIKAPRSKRIVRDDRGAPTELRDTAA